MRQQKKKNSRICDIALFKKSIILSIYVPDLIVAVQEESENTLRLSVGKSEGEGKSVTILLIIADEMKDKILPTVAQP